MGNGSIVVEDYKTKKGYFMIRDTGRKSQPTRLLVVPFKNCDGDPFFYVEEKRDRSFEVTGEGYTHYENWEASMSGYRKEIADTLEFLVEKHKIGYYFIDSKGKVLREEWVEFPLKT